LAPQKPKPPKKAAAKAAKPKKAAITPPLPAPVTSMKAGESLIEPTPAKPAENLTAEMKVGQTWSPKAKEHLENLGIISSEASPNEINIEINDPHFGSYPMDTHWEEALDIHNSEMGNTKSAPTPAPATGELKEPITDSMHEGWDWSPKALEFVEKNN